MSPGPGDLRSVQQSAPRGRQVVEANTRKYSLHGIEYQPTHRRLIVSPGVILHLRVSRVQVGG